MKRREFITLLGGATAWPLAARAQQRALPVIGYLNSLSAENETSSVVAAFRQGIGEQGYVEGRNVEVLYRFADKLERLPDLAADLVRRRVVAIFAAFAPAALAAKRATGTIPIVFVTGADPIQAGLVASLNRPGGNVTGATFLTVELIAKRLELLHEIAPAAKSIGYLYTPIVSAIDEPSIIALETAARTLGLRLVTTIMSTPSQTERAFAMLVGEGIGALLIGTDVFNTQWRNQIIALAAHYALPAVYPNRLFVEADGLISYRGNGSDAEHVAGTYVGRILKGEKPADLPVQQSTRIEMALNLKTAKALGLNVPQTLLVATDEVIE
jgi:putative tryptophan/tyrosine transport system substrate-binding protein